MDRIAKFLEAFLHGDDILGLINFGSFGDDLFEFLNHIDGLPDGVNNLGKASAALGILGALLEGAVEYEGSSPEELVEHIAAEGIEFGLEAAIRIAMYTNPVTGTVMAAYDLVHLWAAIDDDVYQFLGIENPPDLEIPDFLDIDHLTDAAGDGIVDAVQWASDAASDLIDGWGWTD